MKRTPEGKLIVCVHRSVASGGSWALDDLVEVELCPQQLHAIAATAMSKSINTLGNA